MPRFSSRTSFRMRPKVWSYACFKSRQSWDPRSKRSSQTHFSKRIAFLSLCRLNTWNLRLSLSSSRSGSILHRICKSSWLSKRVSTMRCWLRAPHTSSHSRRIFSKIGNSQSQWRPWAFYNLVKKRAQNFLPSKPSKKVKCKWRSTTN